MPGLTGHQRNRKAANTGERLSPMWTGHCGSHQSSLSKAEQKCTHGRWEKIACRAVGNTGWKEALRQVAMPVSQTGGLAGWDQGACGEAWKRKLAGQAGSSQCRALGANSVSFVSFIIFSSLFIEDNTQGSVLCSFFLDTFPLSYFINSPEWLHGQLKALHLRPELHLNLQVCVFICCPSLSLDCPQHPLNLYTFFVGSLSLSPKMLPLPCFLFFQAEPLLHPFECFQRPDRKPS